jgi:hypothetical protein
MVKTLGSGIFSRMRSSKTRAGAVALACFSLGCSGDAEPDQAAASPSSWVGAVQGSDVKVALADRGGSAALFFCGGDASYRTDTRWFNQGAMLAEPFSFSEAGWNVEGVMMKGSLSGNVQTEAEDTRAWRAEPVDPQTLAGLYEGDAPCGKIGLIVSQASPKDAPTGQGACLRVEQARVVVEQVNPVRLELNEARELFVTVESALDERFTVRPVASARR